MVTPVGQSIERSSKHSSLYCSSSASTVSQLNFLNCNFIHENNAEPWNSSLEDEHFSLKELAHHYGVYISEYTLCKRGDSNKAVIKIIQIILMRNNDYKIEGENNLVFNGENVRQWPEKRGSGSGLARFKHLHYEGVFAAIHFYHKESSLYIHSCS